MILHAMASTTKIERLQYLIFFVEAIAFQRDISFRKPFVKNGFRETSDGYFIIKGFHVYRRSHDISEKLKYVLEETKQT